MHYFIDGYNLMYRLMRAGDDLKSSRESFIASLNEKIQLLEIDATIVFDAHYQPGEGSRTHLQSFEICFTEKGETADDYILKRVRISPNPRQETVVTSDGKLAWKARSLLAQTITVEKFMAFLNKRYSAQFSKAEGNKHRAAFKPPLKAAKEQSQQKQFLPLPGETVEENYDYYLFHFEQRYAEIKRDVPVKEIEPRKDKKRKKQTKPPKSEEQAVSEFERWLRIFEERDQTE